MYAAHNEGSSHHRLYKKSCYQILIQDNCSYPAVFLFAKELLVWYGNPTSSDDFHQAYSKPDYS